MIQPEQCQLDAEKKGRRRTGNRVSAVTEKLSGDRPIRCLSDAGTRPLCKSPSPQEEPRRAGPGIPEFRSCRRSSNARARVETLPSGCGDVECRTTYVPRPAEPPSARPRLSYALRPRSHARDLAPATSGGRREKRRDAICDACPVKQLLELLEACAPTQQFW